MADPLVFLSHITEEAELATIVREAMEEAFLRKIRFFQSSYSESISGGQKWLDEIDDALQACDGMIILASAASVQRRWINFEAGGGWVRKIRVIPFCHTDLSVSGLPMPLSALQGYNASDEVHLEAMVGVLAKEVLKSAKPKINYKSLSRKIKDFEFRYGTLARVVEHARQIRVVLPDLADKLFRVEVPKPCVGDGLSMKIIDALQKPLAALQAEGFITFKVTGETTLITQSMAMRPIGTLTVNVTPELTAEIAGAVVEALKKG